MTKPKTLEQLRTEKEQAETQLAQEQHKLERLENRKKYLEKGERTKRTHRLCNLGGTIESLAPEVKDLTRTEMTELMEYIFSLAEVQRAVRHMAITHISQANRELAYSFDIALQNEFSLEENIALARQFLLENFVSRGMVVDFAVHQPDREDGGIPNPHFHVLCPIRPIEQKRGKDGKVFIDTLMLPPCLVPSYRHRPMMNSHRAFFIYRRILNEQYRNQHRHLPDCQKADRQDHLYRPCPFQRDRQGDDGGQNQAYAP